MLTFFNILFFFLKTYKKIYFLLLTKFINMFNIISDYDNTILNCDSDYLWGFFLFKLKIFNCNNKNINIFFYYLYEKSIINNYCYNLFFEFFFLKIKKIKIIYNYIIKIFYNGFLIKSYKCMISSSSNYNIINNKFKLFNYYLLCSYKNKTNIKQFKVINFLKIKFKKKIFISDSINDVYFFFFNKINLIINSDKVLYFLTNLKKINKTLLFK